MPLRSLIAGALAAALMVVPAAQAQDAPDPATVLATVNDTEITLGHVIALRAELPPQYDQFPAEMLFQGILDQLIQQTLLMQSFEGDPSRQAEILLENERRAVIAGEVIAELVGQGIDEAALQAAYDEQYPANTDELEYHAAHILVETEEEAQALIAELADGADFAELARENSTGPSATVGGDLGWFGEGDMVSEFFDAASALEPGEVSAPLETQFGWHVVKLEETRKRERPDLETVRAELEEQLHTLALTARLEELTEAATIERADPASIDPEAINDRSILED
ncbi:peptidylprolyl isomerase [Roseovarius amoyensis]|uniref:peptidylprolyl isomerase n=1 Tax=Roseovarius amoyensis TaxID=2211448 RepID=UPI000DBE5F2C|nr:peptidylprolyl isomerase [Roseovarius amoyensis]